MMKVKTAQTIAAMLSKVRNRSQMNAIPKLGAAFREQWPAQRRSSPGNFPRNVDGGMAGIFHSRIWAMYEATVKNSRRADRIHFVKFLPIPHFHLLRSARHARLSV